MNFFQILRSFIWGTWPTSSFMTSSFPTLSTVPRVNTSHPGGNLPTSSSLTAGSSPRPHPWPPVWSSPDPFYSTRLPSCCFWTFTIPLTTCWPSSSRSWRLEILFGFNLIRSSHFFLNFLKFLNDFIYLVNEVVCCFFFQHNSSSCVFIYFSEMVI